MGRLGPADFGVAHGGRGVAVDAAEIALPVDEGQPHGEFLGEAHQRVIDRLVAMRVVFADDVADHAGGFAVGLVPVVAVLMHRKEDAPVHRLQPVAHIGKRAAHDHAHRVIEVGPLQLRFDGDGGDIAARRCASGLSSPAIGFVFAQTNFRILCPMELALAGRFEQHSRARLFRLKSSRNKPVQRGPMGSKRRISDNTRSIS